MKTQITPGRGPILAVTGWLKNTISLPRWMDNRQNWIRIGIILLTLALAAGLGLFTSSDRSMLAGGLILGAIAGLVIMLILSEHLDWGLILLMITAAYTPFSLPTGTNSRIVDSMVVTILFLGLWVLRMFIVERRFHLIPSPVNAPMLGFMLVVVISWVWSIVFRDPQVITWSTFPFVQVASTVLMVTLPGAFLLVANHTPNERNLRIATVLMVIAGALGVISHFMNINTVNTGGLMSMWVMAICTALALYYVRLPILWRAVLVAIAGAWVVWGFVINLSWVAGWLPGMLAIAVIVFMRSRKLFFLAVVGMLLVGFIFKDHFLNDIQQENQVSGITRTSAWVVNWRVTGNHLLFGTGPGGYAAYYMSYFPYEAMATHNNYIDIVSQTGLVGMGVYLWAFGAILWQGFHLTRRLKGRNDFLEGMAVAAFAGTIACLVIMGFGDWLLPFAYTQTIAGFDYAVFSWMFMGAIVAIDHMVPVQAATESHD